MSYIQCFINNLSKSLAELSKTVQELYQSVYFTGFRCRNKDAAITIGSESLTLTSDKIQCTNDLSIDCPLLKIEKDQSWSGIVYARDGEKILLNPATLESSFQTYKMLNTNVSRISKAIPNECNEEIICPVANLLINAMTRTRTENYESSTHSFTAKTYLSIYETEPGGSYNRSRRVPNGFQDKIIVFFSPPILPKNYELQEINIKKADNTNVNILAYVFQP
jgi:hypothetical protein